MLEIPEYERRKNSIGKTLSERRTEGSSERRNQGGKRNNRHYHGGEMGLQGMLHRQQSSVSAQEQDRAIVFDPYPVDGGTQAEGTELVAEEFSAEAPGESQAGERETEGTGASEDLMGVLTPQELGIAQRSDTTLKIIREKVWREGSPYFWEKGILRRQPYSTMGKILMYFPKLCA